jgi:hypothetical protein
MGTAESGTSLLSPVVIVLPERLSTYHRTETLDDNVLAWSHFSLPSAIGPRPWLGASFMAHKMAIRDSGPIQLQTLFVASPVVVTLPPRRGSMPCVV